MEVYNPFLYTKMMKSNHTSIILFKFFDNHNSTFLRVMCIVNVSNSTTELKQFDKEELQV